DNWWWIRLGIGAMVDSRVLPLWDAYVGGGSPPRDLSSTFGADFTASPTTRTATAFLMRELRASLAASPPAFPPGVTTVTVDIPTQPPPAIAALGAPASPNQMNFNIPSDIAGNIAGGIGKDQLTCRAGAMPSPFNDDRTATGTAVVTQTGAGLTVI